MDKIFSPAASSFIIMLFLLTVLKIKYHKGKAKPGASCARFYPYQ
ncbi:MAG: hypothetical protein RHS_0695 [Robinsoniella sp. RHS]|nr:MAG: hypothetical protein RHS_0695 [Robinsoniella sp. RHS]